MTPTRGSKIGPACDLEPTCTTYFRSSPTSTTANGRRQPHQPIAQHIGFVASPFACSAPSPTPQHPPSRTLNLNPPKDALHIMRELLLCLESIEHFFTPLTSAA